MLSRLAWHVYWLSRYAERVENSARLIAINEQYNLDRQVPRDRRWTSLLRIIGPEGSSGLEQGSHLEIVRFLLTGASNPHSIYNSICRARENAQSLRDQLPIELQEHINLMHHYAQRRLFSDDETLMEELFVMLRDIVLSAELFFGITGAVLDRNHAYSFLQLGRMLERGDMLTRVLDVHVAAAWGDLPRHLLLEEVDADPAYAAAILRSLSCLLSYRQRYPGVPQWQQVLEFLLQDGRMPRTFTYCIRRLQHLVMGLPGGAGIELIPDALEVRVQSLAVRRLNLNQFELLFDDLQLGLQALDGRIAENYFGYGTD